MLKNDFTYVVLTTSKLYTDRSSILFDTLFYIMSDIAIHVTIYCLYCLRFYKTNKYKILINEFYMKVKKKK